MLTFALALAALLRPVAIEGTARCPSPAALGRALAKMLPDAELARRAGALVVRVEDLGAAWRLHVGEDTRELNDGARHCEERARQAAVVVALALAPPSVEQPPTEEAPAPTAEAQAPPPSEAEVRAPIEERPAPPARDRMLALELGARLDMAPSADGGALAQGGVAFRLAFGRHRFAGVLGIAATTPTTMDLAPEPVRLTRIPMDLSARYVARAGRRAETAFDLGAAFDVLLLEGTPGRGGSRLSMGVRAAASERFWVRDDMAVFASAEATFLPATYALVVDSGSMSRPEGRTPALWLAISLGWTVRFQ